MFTAIMSACSKSTGGGENDKVQVTTTIAQIADVAANVGGSHVEVTSLMGPGIDPHLYQASQGDIQKLNKADIIFYNGLHLEGKMGEIFEKMSNEKPTVPVAETIPKTKLMSDPANKKAHDPHVWFDISLWMYTVDKVEDELSKLSPENKRSLLPMQLPIKRSLQKWTNMQKSRFNPFLKREEFWLPPMMHLHTLGRHTALK